VTDSTLARGSIRVEVSPRVLSWAVSRSGNQRVVRRFPKLSDWLSGTGRPTLAQLERLAKATATPLGYFFLANPPEVSLPIPLFRTFAKDSEQEPSADFIEVVLTMKQRQTWMREYLIEDGASRLPFVGSARVDANPRDVAREMRETLGLATEWAAGTKSWTSALRYLLERTESIGVLVVVPGIVGNNTRRKLDPREFRGFVLIDEYAPLLLINGRDAKAAQMFTLAHELAHIWFGVSAAFDLENLQPAKERIEHVCNEVAAEFLVPEEEFREVWPQSAEEAQHFQALARYFKVSELVVARRAVDLGLITRDKFTTLYRDYQAKERRIPADEGGDFYLNQNMRLGRRFAEAVIRAVREGRLLYHEAYRLTGLHGRVFEEYARRLELGNMS